MRHPNSSHLVWILLLALVPFAASTALAGLTVTSVSPDEANAGSVVRNASWGGRVQNLAIDPTNDDIAFAATEYGGLYKTIDGGNSWFRLDNHLPNVMFDVAINPGNVGTIYATSFYDGKQIGSVSGIQVSFDGGATWIHPASANPPAPCPMGVRTEPSAFGISVAPDNPNNVFAGTNCGLAISNDAGLTWTHVVPTSTAGVSQLTIVDVVAQAGGIVDVFGSHGHTRSTNSGVTWTANNTGLNPLPGSSTRGSITSSPLSSNILFAGVGRGGGLWESDDGGANWTNIDDTQSNRTPFVSTIQTGGNSFDLWFSDGVKVRQVNCNNAAATPCGTDPIDGTVNLGSDRTDGAHDDATDIEFRQDGCPYYFSSDGGVYRNDSCPGNPGWVRAMAGIRAMWVFGFDGSEISGPDTSLHFGVQDDGVWGSPDAGATWDDIECCDGFDNVAGPDRTVYTVCCGFDLRVADADDATSNNSAMNMPPGTMPTFNHLDVIDQFASQSYVAVTTGAGGGIYVTTDEGSNWIEIGNASSPAMACGVRASVSLGTPTFYVKTGSCNGGGGNLFKYSGIAPNGTWTAADNGLTSVGVFGVDPGNPNRLYAADLASPTRMVFSNDGGITWQPDTNLDQLMQGNGVFEYTTANGPTFFHSLGGYSQPTLVAFDPDDSNRLIAAAVDSGVFASTDGGQTWGLVADDIPRVYHAYFDTLSPDVFIGSQGRGLWRIHLASADLGVTKVDSPDPVNAGEQLYYTITVENFGPDDATDVVVIDSLPDEVDFITDDLAICSEAAGVVTCQLGDVAVGETSSVVIKTKVHADTVVNAGQPTSIQNTVSVTSAATDDPNPANDAQTIGTIVEDLADVAVTKLCEPDRTIPAGETALCTIIVDNYGPSDARNVVALDALASEGSFQIIGTPTASQGGPCMVWDSTWTCNLGVLPAATETVAGRATIEVEITAEEQVDIADLTKVVSNTPDPEISNNESSDVILVLASADLTLSKSDSPDPVLAGENLTYSLTIGNDGPSTAENVVVRDVLPAGVSIVSVSGSGGASCNPGVPGDPFAPTTCSFGTLAPSAARSMTVVVTVDPGTRGQLDNNARIVSDTVDPNTANDLATASTQVDAEADLAVAKADLQDPVIAGEILDYELTVTNAGPSSSRNVVVTDVLPAAVTFLSATILDGSGECVLADPPTNTVECHIGEIPPNAGTPVFIDIKGRVDPSTPDGPIVNDASVASTETADPNAGNDTTSESTEVITRADVVVEKTSNQDTYKPSSQVIYTITVTNLGSSDAQNVVVTDVLPTQKHDFLLDTAGCSGGPTGTLTCNLGTLAAGQVTAFNVHIKMKGASGEITNTVSVATSTVDPDPSNNTDVLVNLVKGGTSEGGGTGPGNNGAESLESTAECSFEDPTQLVVKLRWTPGPAALEQGSPQRIEVSPQRGRFDKRPQVKLLEVGPRAREMVFYDLKGALVYYWRIATNIRGEWVPSDVVEFETPGCAPAEDLMNRP